MGKHTVPQKARKAGTSGPSSSSAPKQHAHSGGGGGRKHGGLGSANAFENLTYRSKHEVLQLGKAKGKLKRPAASQSASLAARQQSLLAELGSREKANTWVDERLEEGNSALDAEDKLLLRFQKERQKRLAQRSKFAMDDGEDSMQLTHQGQALSLSGPSRRSGEDEDGEPADEDEAEQRLRDARAENEEDDGAAGSGDDEERKEGKSKHEVMSEVMLKSKMYRAERAVLAGEQQDLMGNLDAEFDAVRASMQWASREDREASRRARAVETKGLEAHAAKKQAARKGDAAADDVDVDGDVLLTDGLLDPTDEFVVEAKQLGLDVRAKATDRLKSDEELIAQEKRRLEKLERQRLKRMRGDTAGDDGAAEEDDDEPSAKRRRERREAKDAAKPKKALARTDDDLESNVKLTSSAVGGRSADQVDDHELISDDEGGKGSGDDDEEDSDEDDSDDDSDEEEDDDAEPMEAEEEEEAPLKAVFIGSKPAAPASASASGAAAAASKKPEQREIFIGKDGKSSVSSALLAITAKLAGQQPGGAASSSAAAGGSSDAARAATAASTLPFTFPAPANYKEFKSLLASYPSSQHSLIIARIRTCNHVSLSPDNKAKMDKFFSLLLTHMRRMAQDFAQRPEGAKSEDGVAALIARMDEIAVHVAELSEQQSMNATVGRAFRAQLAKMRSSLDQEGSTGVPPSFQVDELLLLKLVTSLFPMSDFRHNITTPALLLMAEQLNRLPVRGAADVLKGFFVVSLVLHSVNASKRIVPEILTFLHSALLHGLGIARSAEDKVPASTATSTGAQTAANGSSKANGSTKANKGSKTVAATASAASETGAPPTGQAHEVFSVKPSALRLHSSLQPRNCNFEPSSEQLALWKTLVATPAPAASAVGKKNKKSDSAAAAAAAAQTDLHVPLHWLFHDNDAEVFSSSAPTASGSPSLAVTSFSTLLQLIHQAAQLWHSSCVSYAELFVPILDTLSFVLSEQEAKRMCLLPPLLQTYTSHLHSYLCGSMSHSVSLRVPLTASLAPLALKQHEPLFHEGYNPTKDYDPIKERAHIKELGAKLKREKKGALRELRRDTAVVVQQQRAVQNAYAAEREQKRKQVWSQMEEQARDTNILQKASKKKEDKKDAAKKSRKK